MLKNWLGKCGIYRMLIGFSLLSIALVLSYWFERYREFPTEMLTLDEPVEFVIAPGENALDVIESLFINGAMNTPLLARVYLWDNELERTLRAGRYILHGELSHEMLFQLFTVGVPGEDIRLIFPEGWRVSQISNHVAQSGLWSEEEFNAAVERVIGREPAFQATPLSSGEGVLFPDTYAVSTEMSAEGLVQMMVHNHLGVMEGLQDEYVEQLSETRARYNLTDYELTIAASIVQAEGQVADEYPTLARVIFNRLSENMPLQMDPTCHYLDAFRSLPIHRACRAADNHFSTYVIEGLPPTPIGNPGRDAMAAVLAPDESEEAASYLYFVARQDGSGRHVFASSYAEHLDNIDRFLR
jgi:UPF0755 protein